MNVDHIKQIDNLIQLNPDKKITGHKVGRLTAAGENYGSLMLSVDIEVEGPDGSEEIQAVAKLVPPNEFIQEVFNTQVTFRNEIAFYKTIVPLLQQFQRQHEVQKLIHFAPEYFGSRLNLTGDKDKVDGEAALVLENLKIKGYTIIDRLEGLELDAAKLVLINLAQLHAVPLALKLQKPEVFDNVIKPYMARWTVKGKQRELMKNDISRLVEETEELKPLKERVLAGYERFFDEHQVREPWGTIVHNDCWTNNNLFKLEGKKVVNSKMVDYQVCNYESPARDVIFLIYSSVKNHVIQNHYDDMLKLYHETFISALEELNCDTTPFSFESFQEEIDFEAKYSQFGHLSFMLLPIYAPRGTVKEISDFTAENVTVQITDLHKEKYVYFCNDFVKKNWV